MDTIISRSAEETRQAGRALGTTLPPGAVLCLDGDLGAGKTEFVRGLAEAFGVVEEVTSPTFPLIQEYLCADGEPFFHIDFYRIDDPAEMARLGLDEVFDQARCAAVEWGGKFLDALPANALHVGIHAEPGGERRITVDGDRFQRKL